MKPLPFPIARNRDLVVQEVPDEVLVYDLKNNKAHCLNSTAAEVWRQCDGLRSAGEIAGSLTAVKGLPVNEDIVWLAIDQLRDIDLLENATAERPGSMSRREAIKKAGLAAAIALPIVASLAAPASALAATSCSCTGEGPVPSCMDRPGCGTNCEGGRCQIIPD